MFGPGGWGRVQGLQLKPRASTQGWAARLAKASKDPPSLFSKGF